MPDVTSEWRQLALSSQGLTSEQPFGSGLAGTLQAIEHLGYVQVDTLSVVERAHHHVLWNRVPDYDLDHLNQLVTEKKIFEYWYHAASYLPMRDYRFALLNMEAIRHGENRYYTKVDSTLMKEILARVRDEGSLRLRDLDKENKTQDCLHDQKKAEKARNLILDILSSAKEVGLIIKEEINEQELFLLQVQFLPQQLLLLH